jgi:hypothetical protein
VVPEGWEQHLRLRSDARGVQDRLYLVHLYHGLDSAEQRRVGRANGRSAHARLFARPQIGTILPDGGVPGPGPAVFLPDGQIVAFGFWWDGPKGSTSRIDNVRLVSPDDDADGVGDAVDSCLPSNAGSTVVIGSCDSAVANTVGEDGCTLADSIGACAVGAASHGTYVSCVSRATNVLQAAGLLSGREKGAIQRCAARAAIP